MGWLANLIAGPLVSLFKDTIVMPILQAYLKSKDVDLEKFKAATPSLEHAVVAVVDANVRFAQIKSSYALSILGWWPFRLILFTLLSVCTVRFCLIVFDATIPKIFGVEPWNIDPITGAYGDAEFQILLFFIIAKPVDTLVSGGISTLSRYLDKK